MATLPENFDEQVNNKILNEKPEDKVNIFADSALGIVRGGIDAVQDVYGLLDFVTGDALPDWNVNPLGESKTTVGKVFQGASNFLTGFIPIAGQVSKLGTAAKIAKGAKALGVAEKTATTIGKVGSSMAAGAITDFAVFDGHEARLSDLIQDTPLANPVTEFLASDKDDNEIVGRLKNAIEGMGLGVISDALISGIKGVKNMRKALPEAKSTEDVIKAMNVDGVALGRTAKELELFEGVAKKIEVPEFKPMDVSPVIAKMEGLDSTIKDITEGPIAQIKTLADIDNFKQSIKQSLDQMPTTRVKFGEKIEDIVKNTAHILQQNPEVMLRNASALGTLDVTDDIISSAVTLEYFAKEAQGAMKKALESQSPEDIAKALAANDKVEKVAYSLKRAGSNQGRELRAIQEIQNKFDFVGDVIKRDKMIELKGGSEEILAQFRRLSVSDDVGGFIGGLNRLSRAGTKTMQVAQEFWVNSILSGAPTQVINITANSAQLFWRPLEGFIGAAFRGDGATAKQFINQMRYTVLSIGDAAKAAFKVLKTSVNILDVDATMFKDSQVRRISGENLGLEGGLKNAVDAIGSIVNLPGRFLQTTDEFFKQASARSYIMAKLERQAMSKGIVDSKEIAEYIHENMHKMFTAEGALINNRRLLEEQGEALAKQQGITKDKMSEFMIDYLRKNKNTLDLDALRKEAMEEARATTFQTKLDEGTFAHALKEMVEKHPMMGFVVPFITTPTNLLKFAFERTPGINLLSKKFLRELMSDSPEVAARAKGKFATGVLITGTAGLLASRGLITGGGPQDPAEKKILMETGWKPYSFKIGDEYVSYQRFDPFATFFGVMGDISDVLHRLDREGAGVAEKLIQSVVVSMTNNITNKSYFQGIAQALDLIMAKENTREQTVKNFVAGFMPNFFGRLEASLGDDTMRETRGWLDGLIGKTPFIGDRLPPRRNILGEDVTDRTRGLVVDAKWLNPFIVSKQRGDKVFDELAKYGSALQNPSSILAGMDLIEVKNDKGQTAYDRWQENIGTVKIKGKTLRQALTDLIDSRAYNKLPDEVVGRSSGLDQPRLKAMQKVISDYRDAAKEQMFKEFPSVAHTVKTKTEANKAGRRGGSLRQFVERAASQGDLTGKINSILE